MSLKTPVHRTIPLRRHLLLIAFGLTACVVLAGFLFLQAGALEAARQRAEWFLRPQTDAVQARLDTVRQPVEAHLSALGHWLREPPEILPAAALMDQTLPHFATHPDWQALEVVHYSGAAWHLKRQPNGWTSTLRTAAGDGATARWTASGQLIEEVPFAHVPNPASDPWFAETRRRPEIAHWTLAIPESAPQDPASVHAAMGVPVRGGYGIRLSAHFSPLAEATGLRRGLVHTGFYRLSGEPLAEAGALAGSGATLPAAILPLLRTPQSGFGAVRFSTSAEPIWALIRPYPEAGNPMFVMVVRVPEAQLLAFEQDLGYSLVLVALGAFLLALLVAAWLGHVYTRPLRDFAERTASLQWSAERTGYFPKSRIRELAALGAAFDQILATQHTRREEEVEAAAPGIVLLDTPDPDPGETGEQAPGTSPARREFATDESGAPPKPAALEVERLELAMERKRLERLQTALADRAGALERDRAMREAERAREPEASREALHALEETRALLDQEQEALRLEKDSFARDRVRLIAREEHLEADRAAMAEDWRRFQEEKQTYLQLRKTLEAERSQLAAEAQALAEQQQVAPPETGDWDAIEDAQQQLRQQQQELDARVARQQDLELAHQLAQQRLQEDREALEAERKRWAQAEAELETERKRLAQDRDYLGGQVVEMMERRDEMRRERDALAKDRETFEAEQARLAEVQITWAAREKALAAAEAALAESQSQHDMEQARQQQQAAMLDARAAHLEAEAHAAAAALDTSRKRLEKLLEREREADAQHQTLADREAAAIQQEQALTQREDALESAWTALHEQEQACVRETNALQEAHQELEQRQDALLAAEETLSLRVRALEERETQAQATADALADTTQEVDARLREVVARESRLSAAEAKQDAHAQEMSRDLAEAESALERRQAIFEEDREAHEQALAEQRLLLAQAETALAARVQALEVYETAMQDGQEQLRVEARELASERQVLLQLDAELARARAEHDQRAESLATEVAHLTALRAELEEAARLLEERTPPAAYKQALESSRRELRQLKGEVEEAYQELSEQTELWLAREQRLLAQRQTLLEMQLLPQYEQGNTAEALRHAASLAAEFLDLQEHSVWMADDHFSELRTADGATALVRAESPMLFMALEHAPVLAVRNLAADPRTREARLTDRGAVSALFVPVLQGRHVRAVILLESAADRAWQTDEENFGQSLGMLLGNLFHDAPRPAPLPPPSHTEAREQLDDYGESPQYRYMVESTGGIVWALNRDGKITFVNPAAEEAYGCPASEMLGKPITGFANGDGGKADLEAMRNVLDGLPSCTYHNTHLRVDGAPLRLAINMAALQDETGDVVGTVVVANTEEDAAQPVAQTTRAGADPLADFPEVVWAVDMSGKITYVNEAVESVYGYRPEEMLGESILMLSAREGLQEDLARLNDALAEKPCYGYLVTHRRKDGSEVNLLILGQPQRDTNGQITGVKGLAIDVSRRKLRVKTKG